MNLAGIIPPLITPLTADKTLDVAGLERIIEHVISGGVHGIFILGTTGEFPSLSPDLRYELVKETLAKVSQRVPVLVGITDTCLSESIKLANFAEKLGASGLILAPPYYFVLEQLELQNYLAKLTNEVSLPVFLYNIPIYTKLSFAPETVLFAAGLKNVSGIKDSSGQMSYFHDLQYQLRGKKEFKIFIGPDELLAEGLLFGARGGINGGANLWPQLYVSLYTAALNHDYPKVQELQAKILDIKNWIYKLDSSASSYFKGLKCALSLLGICHNVLATPLSPCTAEQQLYIKTGLTKLGLL